MRDFRRLDLGEHAPGAHPQSARDVLQAGSGRRCAGAGVAPVDAARQRGAFSVTLPAVEEADHVTVVRVEGTERGDARERAQARAVDALLKNLPHTDAYRYRHLVAAQPPTELNPGERSDVSWITTESVDRAGEVVTARGMDDGQFRANPLVTLGHQYHLPPVGRSLWRRRVRDGARVGVKAKTQYPPRPESWPAADAWHRALQICKVGLLGVTRSCGRLELHCFKMAGVRAAWPLLPRRIAPTRPR